MNYPGKKHEDQCRQCGLCCRLKVLLPSGRIVLQEGDCIYMGSDRRCKVYPNRLDRRLFAGVNYHCTRLDECIKAGLMPNSCAYVGEEYETRVEAASYKTRSPEEALRIEVSERHDTSLGGGSEHERTNITMGEGPCRDRTLNTSS